MLQRFKSKLSHGKLLTQRPIFKRLEEPLKLLGSFQKALIWSERNTLAKTAQQGIPTLGRNGPVSGQEQPGKIVPRHQLCGGSRQPAKGDQSGAPLECHGSVFKVYSL